MLLQRCILLFGESALVGELAAMLRISPLLQVVERKSCAEMGSLQPDVIVVDSAEVTPEQLCQLVACGRPLLALDPETHHLTILASPHQPDLAEIARVVGSLSFALSQPV